MEMLEGVELTARLPQSKPRKRGSEVEYNRAVHRELSVSPVERFSKAARCFTREPFQPSDPRGVSPANDANAASVAMERFHSIGSAFRDPRAIPPLP